MSAKPEAKEAPAKDAEAGAAKGGVGAMLPAILAIVVAPAACWAIANFVLLPKLKAEVAAVASGETPAAAASAESSHKSSSSSSSKKKEGGKGKEGEAEASSDSYDFNNIVVNLAGTMGTRYLKTSFVVRGDGDDTNDIFTSRKAELTDVTIGVLSSLTLADLEEAGSKNILRERLVAAYNQALGHHVVSQIYFSDFVVQ